jgi:diguanylate cyclase (GGDEF)-like protein
MSQPLRIVGSAKPGASSTGPFDLLAIATAALQSSLEPERLKGELRQALSAVLRADRCTLVEGDSSEPRHAIVAEALSRGEALWAEETPSLLCAPMGAGAILVERTDPFTQNDLNLLAAVAPQAALALRNARLYERTTSDGLTGLPGRQRFIVELEDDVREGGTLSLLLVDVDHLADKNDVYGRPVGDRVLAELGPFVRDRLPLAQGVARSGDDEFAALLPGTDTARARDLAEDLRRSVADHEFDSAHEALRLTVSAGIAELRPGEMASSLFSRAAEALAAAKRNGRNRVEFAR